MTVYVKPNGMVHYSCDWGGGCSTEIDVHHDAPSTIGWSRDFTKMYCPEHTNLIESSTITDTLLKVDVLGPNAPTTVNAQGGKQSHLPYRCDLFDPTALLSMAAVLAQGADKYGDNNWHNISRNEHLNHLLVHVLALLADNTEDDHASHILCRAMFACATTNILGTDGYHK